MISSDLSLGGFCGSWGNESADVKRKRKMLEGEGVQFTSSNGRVEKSSVYVWGININSKKRKRTPSNPSTSTSTKNRKPKTSTSTSTKNRKPKTENRKHKITRITTPTSLVTLAATVSLLFSLSSESVFASSVPPAISWTKGYGFGESESHPHAGIELQNGGFVVVGDGVNYQNNTINRTIMILCTDSQGNTIWQNIIGNVGFNYGKYVIERKNNEILIAGAMSKKINQNIFLHRCLIRLNLTNGQIISTILLKNDGTKYNLRDGYMSVVERPDKSVIAVGFIHGENSTTGNVDEPMFLIGKGQVSITKFNIENEKFVITKDIVIASNDNYETNQGMRILNHPDGIHVIVSHTTTFDHGNTFQFGVSVLDGTDLTVVYTKSYPAQPVGHASHPYSLTLSYTGNIVIGGLAVIYDSNNIEQCQGRVVEVDAATGNVLWDQRFTSKLTDTNIECYGIQKTLDNGFILTCGTGVEPELHPKDSKKSKTWRVLVHRTDKEGNMLYQKTYTSNDALQNNAGEYIVALRNGGYVVCIDSQTWGPTTTGGNFAIMKLGSDCVEK